MLKPWIGKSWSIFLCIISFFGIILLLIYGFGIKNGDSQFLHGISPKDQDQAAQNIFIGAGFYGVLLLFGLWQYYMNHKAIYPIMPRRITTFSPVSIPEEKSFHNSPKKSFEDQPTIYPTFESVQKTYK